jgi:predicted nucleic acid-binding protein
VRRAYFDTSAIVKLSHVEPHSQSLVDYLERDTIEVSTSVVAEVETMRAVGRAGADPGEAVVGFYLLALDEEVRRVAAHLAPAALRSIDAIHVATALSLADRDLEFVTYDDRQADAARAAGLKVVQPGR